MPGRSIKIDELSLPDSGDWRAFVDRHEEATLFHTLEWKRAVERAFGHRSWFLIARRSGQAVGVLPLYLVNSLVGGRLLMSVPYATYGGVVADDAETSAALLARAKSLAHTLGARCIEFRSVRAADPMLPVEPQHATFRKGLPSSEDAVGLSFPRKARAAARRASEQHALATEFERGCSNDATDTPSPSSRASGNLRTVWELYSRSMRRLGSPNYPFVFFEELAAAMRERMLVQVVRENDRPVAGLVTFLFRDIVMPYFAGVDERVEIYGLNQFMYHESMRWGVLNGFRQYDFGRSRMDNKGAFAFKRLCGFCPQPLEYQRYVAPGESAPDLAPSSPRWSIARSVWKRLPLPVTRPLGAWLTRSIPG